MSVPAEDEVVAVIEAVVRRELGREVAVARHHALQAELALDSLSLLTLAVELEDRFRVKLNEEDAGSLSTVGDLAALVVRRAGEQR